MIDCWGKTSSCQACPWWSWGSPKYHQACWHRHST